MSVMEMTVSLARVGDSAKQVADTVLDVRPYFLIPHDLHNLSQYLATQRAHKTLARALVVAVLGRLEATKGRLVLRGWHKGKSAQPCLHL